MLSGNILSHSTKKKINQNDHSFSLIVICCHSLIFTRYTTRCHSLSLAVIRCHSLYHSLPLIVTRCHSMYYTSVFLLTISVYLVEREIKKQETLCVVTIAMICSNLASLWKSQYFQGPIFNPVEDLWWSLYCENIKTLSIFTKKLHRRCLHGF